jgi:hypothetical protein
MNDSGMTTKDKNQMWYNVGQFVVGVMTDKDKRASKYYTMFVKQLEKFNVNQKFADNMTELAKYKYITDKITKV